MIAKPDFSTHAPQGVTPCNVTEKMMDEKAKLAILLLRADGERSGMGAQPISQDQESALLARPDLVERRGDRWLLTSEGRAWARANDPRPDRTPTANRLYILLFKISGLDSDTALDAARRGGLDVSRSRAAGWRKHPDDRKHAVMTLGELECVMRGISYMDADDDRAENQAP